MSLFKTVTATELEQARTVEFARDSFEHRPFTLSLRGWILRNVMPINFEAYGAVITPWKASDGERIHPLGSGSNFRGLTEGYRYFGREVPRQLDLERWHDDFRIIEQAKTLPPLFRAIIDRCSDHVGAIYVRCYPGFDTPVFNWKIERNIFFALDDPFNEMPHPRTDFQVFPEGAQWFIHHHDTEPIIYVAGSADLVDKLSGALDDQFVRLGLADRYY